MPDLEMLTVSLPPYYFCLAFNTIQWNLMIWTLHQLNSSALTTNTRALQVCVLSSL